jgi:hypothetical protein
MEAAHERSSHVLSPLKLESMKGFTQGAFEGKAETAGLKKTTAGQAGPADDRLAYPPAAHGTGCTLVDGDKGITAITADNISLSAASAA